jgi:hypothetical protein
MLIKLSLNSIGCISICLDDCGLLITPTEESVEDSQFLSLAPAGSRFAGNCR